VGKPIRRRRRLGVRLRIGAGGIISIDATQQGAARQRISQEVAVAVN
jgi:hypothetical protein